MHDVSVVWVDGKGIFSPQLLLHCTAGICVINWNEHEVYTYVRMRTLRDDTLEMARLTLVISPVAIYFSVVMR